MVSSRNFQLAGSGSRRYLELSCVDDRAQRLDRSRLREPPVRRNALGSSADLLACGLLESECACPATAPHAQRLAPAEQTALLSTERRAKGKMVTVIGGLSPIDNDLSELAARLKSVCGAGGTVKDGQIEVQGDHLRAAERALQAIGYKTKARRPVNRARR